MAISIDWGTKVISVPKTFLSLVSGTLYELDSDTFRLALKDLEDDEEGIPFPDTHQHNTEVTLSGVTFVRTIEIINGYTVEFEDVQYTVAAVDGMTCSQTIAYPAALVKPSDASCGDQIDS